FWTFFFQYLGPSDTGWRPYGLAWPDPSNTIRSAPPDLGLEVTERWRSGDSAVDRLRGIVPAEVEGAPVDCPSRPVAGATASGPVPPTRDLSADTAMALQVAGATFQDQHSARAVQLRGFAGQRRSVSDALRGGAPPTAVADEKLPLARLAQRTA